MVVLGGKVIEFVVTPGTVLQEPPETLPEHSSTKSDALTGQVKLNEAPRCWTERTGGTGQKKAKTVMSLRTLVTVNGLAVSG